MDAIAAIMTRRSVRKYTGEAVNDQEIEKIVRAGMNAPSAGNSQPWHFVVIKDRDTLLAITKFHPYSHMLKEAGVAIVVLGDTSNERYGAYWVQDCSAAIENMLLAVHALGLGAVWLGIYPREDRVSELSKLIGQPANVKPLGIVSVGHIAEIPAKADRFDPERVHKEAW